MNKGKTRTISPELRAALSLAGKKSWAARSKNPERLKAALRRAGQAAWRVKLAKCAARQKEQEDAEALLTPPQ
jgi:hypothetical protein